MSLRDSRVPHPSLSNFAELFDAAEILIFLLFTARVRQVVGFFEAFISQPKDIAAGLVVAEN